MKNVFTPADILIPKESLMKTWSVIACDQFSSEKEYWQRVKNYAGDNPSTLNMIIPEAHLEEVDEEKAIEAISTVMETYLKSGVFREITESFVYVQRTQPDGRVRKGLVGAVAVGLNCSLEPTEMLTTAEHIAKATKLPLIVKPNAGLPDGTHGEYHTGAMEFAEQMANFAKIGPRIVGGCCGTTPDYIRELKKKYMAL